MEIEETEEVLASETAEKVSEEQAVTEQAESLNEEALINNEEVSLSEEIKVSQNLEEENSENNSEAEEMA